MLSQEQVAILHTILQTYRLMCVLLPEAKVGEEH